MRVATLQAADETTTPTSANVLPIQLDPPPERPPALEDSLNTIILHAAAELTTSHATAPVLDHPLAQEGSHSPTVVVLPTTPDIQLDPPPDRSLASEDSGDTATLVESTDRNNSPPQAASITHHTVYKYVDYMTK
jgi:hypothetical protein